MRELLHDFVAAPNVAETYVFELYAEGSLHDLFWLRLGIAFVGAVLKFIQSVDACRGMYQLRHQAEQSQNRVLDLSDQLQEGGHHAEGDGAVAESEAAPNKREQVSEAEGGADGETGIGGKARAAQDFAFQLVLPGIETFRNPFLALERTQHGVVFDAFLYLHLNLAFAVADFKRHFAELARNQLADNDDYGCQQQQRPR